MPDTVHSRVVRAACELIGADQLADNVDVSRAVVQAWLAGGAAPPPRIFLKMLRLLRAADPKYRPA